MYAFKKGSQYIVYVNLADDSLLPHETEEACENAGGFPRNFFSLESLQQTYPGVKFFIVGEYEDSKTVVAPISDAALSNIEAKLGKLGQKPETTKTAPVQNNIGVASIEPLIADFAEAARLYRQQKDFCELGVDDARENMIRWGSYCNGLSHAILYAAPSKEDELLDILNGHGSSGRMKSLINLD